MTDERPSGDGEGEVVLDAAHCEEAKASLERIEKILSEAARLDPSIRGDLLEATRELSHALHPVYEADAAHARSVTHFAEAVTHEASKPSPDPGLIDIGIQGLNRAVRPVQEAEPRLVQIVGRIAEVLANLGI